MKYQIANELPGRLRVKLAGPVPPADLDALYRVLGSCPDIAKSTVYPRIGSVALTYNAAPGGRARVLEHLAGIGEFTLYTQCVGIRTDIDATARGIPVFLCDDI